jgi:polysaccharide export outer membrane protein
MVIAALTALLAAGAQAQEDYRIQPGDFLDLTVVGVPQLQTRSMVGPNGKVSLPLIEDVPAAGRPIEDVRREVKMRLSAKVAPRLNSDGVTDMVAFTPDQISLVVGEYRPVYISGSVVRPGEQRYRLGLTVREALAVAGGLDVPSAAANGSEYALIINELAYEQGRLLRLEAERRELAGDPAPASDPLAQRLGQPGSEAAAEEQVQLKKSARLKETSFLQEAIATAHRHIELLQQRRGNEQQSYEEDRADFERLNDLFRKSVTTAARVSDARRNMLFSATQLLQTDAAIASAQREIITYARQIERLSEESKLATLKDIEDARQKIQTLQTKLMYAPPLTALSSTTGEDIEDKAQVTLVRGDGQRLTASLDTPLRPGDVVRIAVPGLPAGSTRSSERGGSATQAATR